MGLVIPRDTTGRLQFAKSHLATWRDHREQLGLSEDDLDAMESALDEATEATSHARYLKSQAQIATYIKDERNENLQRVLSRIVRTIKATAVNVEQPLDIYAAASIQPPQSGSPRPADAPNNAQATLRNDGTVRLKWKAKRKGGVVFLIDRQTISLDGRSAYAFVAAVQRNSFIDLDVPCGVAQVNYRIRAERGDRSASRIAQATVVFGVKKHAPESSARLAA